jgi:hypothetical protein
MSGNNHEAEVLNLRRVVEELESLFRNEYFRSQQDNRESPAIFKPVATDFKKVSFLSTVLSTHAWPKKQYKQKNIFIF